MKTKLTPQLIEKACQLLRVGNYVETVCGAIGISKETWYRWIREAESPEGTELQRDFHDATTRAINEAEVRAVAQWQKQMPDDWRACKEFLARRYRKRWGAEVPADADEQQDEPCRWAETPAEAGIVLPDNDDDR